MKFMYTPQGRGFIISCLFLLFSFNTLAQVGIGNTNPNNDALLEIGDATTTTKGLLLPRVNLVNTSNFAPMTAHVQGMVVYNKNTAGDVTPGYYYNDGSQWVRIASASVPSNDWTLTGNAGTTAGTNFLGTTDDVSLRIRTNNTDRFDFSTNGRLRSYNNGSANEPTYSWNASSSTGMFRPANNQLGFSTNGSENARIDQNGAFGIGTTNPSLSTYGSVAIDKLNVLGQGTSSGLNFTPMSVFENSGDGAALAIFNTDDGNNDFPVLEVGTNNADGTAIRGININGDNTGPAIGVYGSTNSFSSGWAGLFNGDVGSTSGFYLASDKRWKTNIVSLNNGESMLQKIMQLQPKSYYWRAQEFPGMNFDPNEKSYGFLAQELKAIFPELVASKNIPNPKEKVAPYKKMESVSGYYMVNYTGLIPILTEAIQEQQKTIEALETRINKLESQVQLLLNKSK